MIYLDTHVVSWLYHDRRLIAQSTSELIETEEVRISPMVRLELEYLFEIGRIRSPSDLLITYLSEHIELVVCDLGFDTVMRKAIDEVWTRDPFDRIITAHARYQGSILVTKDGSIHENYDKAVWQ